MCITNSIAFHETENNTQKSSSCGKIRKVWIKESDTHRWSTASNLIDQYPKESIDKATLPYTNHEQSNVRRERESTMLSMKYISKGNFSDYPQRRTHYIRFYSRLTKWRITLQETIFNIFFLSFSIVFFFKYLMFTHNSMIKLYFCTIEFG